MKNLSISFILFNFFMFTSNYAGLWYQLGPSILKNIFKRTTKNQKVRKIENPEIKNLLKRLEYQDFYVMKSERAFGFAHPFGKKVVVSSRIWEGQNLNLIKYVLTHEIAHKKQGNTKLLTVYFSFWISCYLIAYFFWQPSLLVTILAAIALGRIAFLIQREFEDSADQETSRILGKENTIKAIRDLFALNNRSLKEYNWPKKLFFINRDFQGRISAIQKIK